MPAIVEFPHVVRQAAPDFADLFSCEPQRRHFAEYLTGLLVARKKNVSAINREFANTTDQSCLNKFLNEVVWDEKAINERRLEVLQRDGTTRYSDQGVIAIDDVLIDHEGKLIDDVGWFWDHAEDRHKIAHDYLFINYVCQSGKHFPLEFRRFKKREQCEEDGEAFQDHGRLFRDLVNWTCEHDIPGFFTWDSYFSSVENLNHVHAKRDRFGQPRGYVGDLKMNRKIWCRGKEIKAEELACTIAPEDRKELRRGDKRQWYFTCTIHIPKVNHKVRILILWNHRRDASPCKILITNRVRWEAKRILSVYRYRWTGTETFHRDGKQELGMGDCQLRDGQGQTRHMYLVMLAYSLLMSQLRDGRAKDWALHRLTTIGEACRGVMHETLRTTLAWAIDQVTENSQNKEHVMAQLGLT
ncbi:MAG: IS701 family transposase [Planctomycetes bacterium]|nr:IS701 family transposase [Planctomycetota bacterium]